MTEREAAAASARPLPPDDDELKDLAYSAHEEAMSFGLSVGTFMRYFKTIRDRAASAPQAVRMPLTEEQILRTPLDWTGDCDAKIAFARAIEAAHGIVPLAPQDGGK